MTLIRVLLPLIEEKRLEIIESLKSRLLLPHTTSEGETLCRPEELEIGNLHHQVTHQGVRCTPETRRLVTLLRNLRNRLAHTEAIGPELVDMLPALEAEVAG